MIRSMDRLLGKASAEKFEESIKNRNVLNENPLFSKLMFENKVEFYHWNDRLRWKSHYHSQCEISYYNGENSVEYLVGAKKYIMRRGDILYIPPLAVHSALTAELIVHHSFDRYILWIWDDWLKDLFDGIPMIDLTMPVQIVTRGTRWEFLKGRFEEGCQAYERDDCQERIRSIAVQVVSLLACAAADNRDVGIRSAPGALQKAVAYIEKNYRSSLSIREVAENCYVSNSTLSRLFTQNLGISFYQYVTQKRLSAAEEMMKTGISLKEAAFQSGFSDYPSFYRAFRGHYGISPLEYRQIVKISR